MFGKEDNTYNELREKSIDQWLNEMEKHDDIVVRGGVKVTKDYIQSLKQQIEQLKSKNEMKDSYLKKLKKNK